MEASLCFASLWCVSYFQKAAKAPLFHLALRPPAPAPALLRSRCSRLHRPRSGLPRGRAARGQSSPTCAGPNRSLAEGPTDAVFRSPFFAAGLVPRLHPRHSDGRRARGGGGGIRRVRRGHDWPQHAHVAGRPPRPLAAADGASSAAPVPRRRRSPASCMPCPVELHSCSAGTRAVLCAAPLSTNCGEKRFTRCLFRAYPRHAGRRRHVRPHRPHVLPPLPAHGARKTSLPLHPISLHLSLTHRRVSGCQQRSPRLCQCQPPAGVLLEQALPRVRQVRARLRPPLQVAQHVRRRGQLPEVLRAGGHPLLPGERRERGTKVDAIAQLPAPSPRVMDSGGEVEPCCVVPPLAAKAAQLSSAHLHPPTAQPNRRNNDPSHGLSVSLSACPQLVGQLTVALWLFARSFTDPHVTVRTDIRGYPWWITSDARDACVVSVTRSAPSAQSVGGRMFCCVYLWGLPPPFSIQIATPDVRFRFPLSYLLRNATQDGRLRAAYGDTFSVNGATEIEHQPPLCQESRNPSCHLPYPHPPLPTPTQASAPSSPSSPCASSPWAPPWGSSSPFTCT